MVQRRFVFFSSCDSKSENNTHNSRKNERDDKMARALVNAAFKKRVDVEQEDVGGDGEDPGDRREEEPDRGVDDDIRHWIAVEMTSLLVNPLPEIMQLANHLKMIKFLFLVFLCNYYWNLLVKTDKFYCMD